MLPYIVLRWTKISMFWLGIAVSVIVFLYSSYLYCQKNKMDFKQFFFFMPWACIIVYLCGKVIWFYLDSKHPVLGFGGTISFILSPNGSEFEYIGIVLGTVLALLLFFSNKSKNTIKSIVDMLFTSSMYMLMCLGIFLTFSDSVIGQPNDHGRFAIRSLVPYSKVQQYGQIYPYGIIISIIAGISLLAIKGLNRFIARSGIGYLGFSIFLLLLSYSFSYELYPRHGVSTVLGLNLDLRHYLNLALICVCLVEFYRISKNK